MLSLLNKHLKILLVWITLNFFQGIFCILTYTLGKIWFFSIMNLSWAIINLLVVIWIFYHIRERKFEKEDFDYKKKIIQHVIKMLFINIILDACYIIIGISFLYISSPVIIMKDFWTGFGISIIIQGGVLIFLDTYFYLFHKKNLTLVSAKIKQKPENTLQVKIN